MCHNGTGFAISIATNESKEDTKMQTSTTVNQTRVQFASEYTEPSTSVRALQNVVLSQLPGVTFAILTLVYVVASLVRL